MLFDRLTGALKKEVFEYLLEKEVARATRYPFSFSLAVIDLDRADGRHNGTRERPTDVKTLGNLLRTEFRSADILGWEGEGAFCWIMPDTDEQRAQVAGERIRKAVEGFRFNKRSRTISVGIATFPTHSLNLVEMLQKARDRLAWAKARGGNQICIADGASFSEEE